MEEIKEFSVVLEGIPEGKVLGVADRFSIPEDEAIVDPEFWTELDGASDSLEMIAVCD